MSVIKIKGIHLSFTNCQISTQRPLIAFWNFPLKSNRNSNNLLLAEIVSDINESSGRRFLKISDFSSFTYFSITSHYIVQFCVFYRPVSYDDLYYNIIILWWFRYLVLYLSFCLHVCLYTGFILLTIVCIVSLKHFLYVYFTSSVSIVVIFVVWGLHWRVFYHSYQIIFI